MSEQKTFNRKRDELTTRVSLHSSKAIEIAGQVLTPDRTRAYVEFYLSHALPVVTSDNCAIHPKVVVNSYGSMLHQVFDLAHLIVQYNPEENPRDRILGSVVAVELTAARSASSATTVGASKTNAMGIRAAAVMHKQAEGVDKILETFDTKRLKWTVSMEVEYWLDNSGFAIAGRKGVEKFEESTPKDIRQLGYIYVSWVDAPEELRACAEENTPVQQYQGQETILLQGGLDGFVHYKGVGLTPLGKESEARVNQMLNSGVPFAEQDGELVYDLASPLRKTLELIKGKA